MDIKQKIDEGFDAVSELAAENGPQKHPLFIRVCGIVSLIGGFVQSATFILLLLLIAFVYSKGDLDTTILKDYTTVTIVVAAVEIALSFALAILFFVLGLRLIGRKLHRAATLANLMIALEIGVLLCQALLTGLSSELIPSSVNLVILIALQTYCDPALRGERHLQRHLKELEIKHEAEEGTLGRDTTGKGYITLNFFNLFWVFVICSVLGLAIEDIYHVTIYDPGHYQDRAGLLYGPFSPIYGFGAVLMTVALNRFHDKNFVLIFLVSAIIGGCFEFFTSWFMETAFGIVAWNYSGTFLNIDGRTNAMFMAMWGVLGLVWVKLLLPVMLKIVNLIPWNWRYGLTVFCATLMAADCVLTLAALDCWFQREAGTMDYKNPSAIVQFCNEHYTDAFMTDRFQTMTMNPDSAARLPR